MSREELAELRKLLASPQKDEEPSSFREDAGLIGLGLIWGCVLGVVVFFLRYGQSLISNYGCP